ncbi:MAG TPA: hypothetical protein VD970_03295 [Acetobacteraceae bacterium]|nr:hypothetical protein [Acetobacteraceae bacterium]
MAALVGRFAEAGFDVVQTASLYSFDGTAGFSVAAGQ